MSPQDKAIENRKIYIGVGALLALIGFSIKITSIGNDIVYRLENIEKGYTPKDTSMQGRIVRIENKNVQQDEKDSQQDDKIGLLQSQITQISTRKK